MLELACRECDFHFNKKHLEDPTIPMWTIRAKGKSYYVNHVTANMPWSTKESPDNTHTKGAIKFKDVHLKIDADNCAELCTLTGPVAARLRAKEKGYTRILISYKDKVAEYLQNHGIRFTPFKRISGSCGSSFHICDIIDPNDVVMMRIGLEQYAFRVLNENETYYMAYDDPALLERLDADDYDDLYEE
jgi:dissimilatory sulfite reductase (desulfoviridin) alpha/beta subunit